MDKASRAREATELLVEILHVQKRRFQAVAKEYGLSPQQAATLTNLDRETGLPMSALAEVLMCDASNVTGIVDKLEARGFVKREQGEDRRVKVLRLTVEGDSLRAEMRARLLTPPPWLENLPADDLTALTRVLRRASELSRGHKE